MISPKAKVGKGVRIGIGTRISQHAVIADETVIGDACNIGFEEDVNERRKLSENPYYKNFLVESKKCVIGKSAVINSGTSIARNVVVGQGSVIGNNCLIRSHCRIGQGVIIGFSALLEPFVVVGDGTKILNFCAIGSTSRIGRFVFIAPSVMLAENKYLLGNYAKSRGPIIGDYARIGCNSTIITCDIGDHSYVGANSVVTRDIPSGFLFTNKFARKLSRRERDEYIESLQNMGIQR